MESEKEWQSHLQGIVASLAPEGHLEQALARRVATLLWRIDRVTRYEVAMTTYQVATVVSDRMTADAYLFGVDAIVDQADGKRDDLPEPTPEEIVQAREMRVIPWKDGLDRIMRYEAHLHRQCLQTLHEIEALQARRRGEPAHLARLDISAPPLS